MKKTLLLLALSLFSLAATAVPRERFTVVTIHPATKNLQLFLADSAGRPFNDFSRLSAWLVGRGKQLRFAMNAGMYHADFSPVGLLVQDGKQISPLNLSEGAGNFFMKPNGVFLVGNKGARVVTSANYDKLADGVRLATQSGPMLVIDGAIHPMFNPASRSRHLRNGVGVAGGKVFFVISNEAVTFHELAVYFRDVLHCKNALYLDGAISRLHLPAQGRSDVGAPLGPIVGVAE
jgi:uncharacterized protein YigE (DUF2233 family)